MTYPTVKSIIAGLDSRDLRKEVELAFHKFGAEGWAQLHRVLGERDLKPRQIANGLKLLMVTRGPADSTALFQLSTRMLESKEERVRSSAAVVAVHLLYTPVGPPDVSMDDRRATKQALKMAQNRGLDEKTAGIVTAFFEGTLAW